MSWGLANNINKMAKYTRIPCHSPGLGNWKACHLSGTRAPTGWPGQLASSFSQQCLGMLCSHPAHTRLGGHWALPGLFLSVLPTPSWANGGAPACQGWEGWETCCLSLALWELGPIIGHNEGKEQGGGHTHHSPVTQ